MEKLAWQNNKYIHLLTYEDLVDEMYYSLLKWWICIATFVKRCFFLLCYVPLPMGIRLLNDSQSQT